MPTVPVFWIQGLQKENFGFMDLQGFMDIEFPRDVYGWIIQQRKTMAPASDKQSALDYKGIYLPQHETKISFELIEEIKGIIKQINV